MRSRLAIRFAAVAAAILIAAVAVGCRQTRPVPIYEPLLVLEANSGRPIPMSADSFRPSWSGPKPASHAGGG